MCLCLVWCCFQTITAKWSGGHSHRVARGGLNIDYLVFHRKHFPIPALAYRKVALNHGRWQVASKHRQLGVGVYRIFEGTIWDIGRSFKNFMERVWC